MSSESARSVIVISVEIDEQVTGLSVGIVEAAGIVIAEASQELRAFCDETATRVLKDGMGGGEERRQAVRSTLRAAGFKPAGRNKPAQEYLLRTVEKAGQLPAILNVVDLLNAVSLSCGLPISMLAIDRLSQESSFRYGREDESFVFNRSGQELSLHGLICWCSAHGDDSRPLGTPVKDSMEGKVTEQDQHIAACIYAAQDVVSSDELAQSTDMLKQGLEMWCGATVCESRID